MFTLDESIQSARECIELLLDNRFNEALEESGKYAADSMYASHGHSLLLWLKAYLTLEMPEILKAQTSSEQTLELCETIRPQNYRDNFFVKLFLKPNYEEFTDEEIHAELIRVEQIVFGTMMEFFIDQSLFVLVRVSLRLRTCHQIYKAFSKVLETKEWTSDVSLNEFKSAVKLGLGVYNLMFSLLPEKVMGLLSVVGYKGSRYEGIKMLNESAFSNTLHAFPSKMVVGAFECFLDQIFNVSTVKAPAMEKHIETGLRLNEQCIWFLIFKGRIQLIRKDINGALESFNSSLELTLDVKQFTNLYLWEIMWCHALQGNWLKATEYSHKLRENCPWSVPTFYYMEAIFLYMEYEKHLISKKKNFSKSKEGIKMHQQIDALLNEVPHHVKRYAGRRIPVEKYVCEKVLKYKENGNVLPAPGYELFLAWNMFIFIEGQTPNLEPIFAHIEQCMEYYNFNKASENYLMLCLIKGVTYRCMGNYKDAEKEFFKIVAKFDDIEDDKHIGPLTTLELAMVKMNQQHFGEARHWLHKTKNDFSSFALELLIQLRVQTAQKILRKMQKQNPQQGGA